MHIGIYDTEHFETSYTITKLFDISSNNITLFVTQEIATSLKYLLGDSTARYTWIILDEKKLRNAYDIYLHCKKNKIDLLLLNTVSSHHLAFGVLCFFLKNTKTIITIHDANSFFKPKLAINFRSLFRFSGKKLLAQTVSKYAVLLFSTKNYINKKFSKNKEIFCFPGSFFDKKLSGKIASENRIKIAIPGSIDCKRRNYNHLFNVLAFLINEDKSFEFILLGGAKDEEGKKIIDTCKRNGSTNIIIKTYEEGFVCQEEYDYQLANCDIIFAPLKQIFSEESSLPEEYGLTKSSGSFFDAIRFGKPILLPDYIYLPLELTQQCIVYNSTKELADLLNHLTPSVKEFHLKNAIHNSLNFTLPAIRAALAGLIK